MTVEGLVAVPASAVDFAVRLHAAVDEVVAPIVVTNAARMRCARGCAGCCVDGLTVFAVEAALLLREHAALFAGEAPHPEGACALLDAEGACRAYASRPFVCRTQGLPLRWLEEGQEGEVRELRDECGLNGLPAEPLEALPAERCFPLGPFEARLAAVDAKACGEGAPRVALRSLFGGPAGPSRRLPVVPA